jgi:hypothetical protein|tara:strand:- start:888 stop:1148 length:261 start_codon:yes stop_codon:yes gene_type:complete
MRKLSFLSILFPLIVISNAYPEINEAQQKIIKSQIILIHEGMVSEKEVFRKAKLFDKEGILGIGKSEMSQEEFKSFLNKESLHFGY